MQDFLGLQWIRAGTVFERNSQRAVHMVHSCEVQLERCVHCFQEQVASG